MIETLSLMQFLIRQLFSVFTVLVVFGLFTPDLFAGKKEEKVCAECAVTAPEGGRAYAICVAAGLAGSEFDTCFKNPKKCFGKNNTIREYVSKLFGRDDGPYINKLMYVVPYREGCIAVWKSGVYLSRDGKNLGGGGETVNVWKVKNPHEDLIKGMVVFNDCVISAFSGRGIYKSCDGLNIGGGGGTKSNTNKVYQGGQTVKRMTVTDKGLRTVFEDGSCYLDPSGDHPAGGPGVSRCH